MGRCGTLRAAQPKNPVTSHKAGEAMETFENKKRRAGRGRYHVMDAGQSRSAGGARRQVYINGRRIRTIDMHAHLMIRESMELIGEKGPVKTKPIVPEQRLAEMDEQGIDVEVLSTNPFWYHLDRDMATRFISIQNEKLSELCASHPDRFVALASVALQHPDLAVKQLDHAIKNLGLRGVAIGTHVGEEQFSDPRFDPFWTKCEELGVVVFLHPLNVPELRKRLKGSGWLDNIVAFPLATTIALTHLIFEGTLDRFPGLKFCSAHGGGYLPSYAARSDIVARVRPDMCPVKLNKAPTEYLKQMYFDSILFTQEGLRHLIAQVGVSQICVGTDHPVGWENNPVDFILSMPDLSDAERESILGGTAAKLLGIA
jgi:aminocarboxymuconate-semialdehyde decarboxylase